MAVARKSQEIYINRDIDSTIKEIENSFVVQDIDSTEDNRKIPLWLFGFLY